MRFGSRTKTSSLNERGRFGVRHTTLPHDFGSTQVGGVEARTDSGVVLDRVDSSSGGVRRRLKISDQNREALAKAGAGGWYTSSERQLSDGSRCSQSRRMPYLLRKKRYTGERDVG